MPPRRTPRRAGLLVGLLILVACQEGGGSVSAPTIDCPTTAPVMSAAPGPSTPASPSNGADPSASPTPAPLLVADLLEGVSTAVVETSLGSFTIALEAEGAPIATANFVALARCGFYDGITFHRVLAGFVIQAGDPNTRENQGDFEGLGTGGPGYRFTVEVPPEGLNYDPYAVAMANTGRPDSNGSQFFICLTDLDNLETFAARGYTIFGTVTEGREVVDAIGLVEVVSPITGVPVDPVVINTIEVPLAESTPSGN